MRTLSPLGWLAGGVVALIGLVLVLGGLGFRWDPFDLSRRRIERAEQSAARSEAVARSRQAEAAGQAGQLARLDAALQTTRSLDRATDRSIQTARDADDADLPIPSARAERLRDHDRELCRLAPELGGCPAPTDAAGDGEPTV